MKTIKPKGYERIPVRIRSGWDQAGRRAVTLGPAVEVYGMSWTPLLFDGEEDPDWHKTRGLDLDDGDGDDDVGSPPNDGGLSHLNTRL